MTGKRHAKPTAIQLFEKSQRQFKKEILTQIALIRSDMANERRFYNDDIRPDLNDIHRYAAETYTRCGALIKIVDHCARLLREKETLQRRLAMYDPPHIGSHPGYLYCINRISKGEKCGADRAPITDRLTLVDLNNKEQSKERKEALEKRAADILNAAFDTANGGRAEHE
jgi:hypothetical protein